MNPNLIAKSLVLFLIKIYQKAWSRFTTPSCRFYPTCSQYAYEAVLRYGVIKGCFLAVKRLLKCHPFHPGGVDTVKGEC